MTIIKKELLLYFVSLSNFLVFAATSAVVVFLFINNFYSLNVSSLGGLFNLFPWTFALLVPAVAMGIFAQERKTKTLQYLMSNPISEAEIILGKYLGALAFLGVFVLATLFIPATLSQVAIFDWGVIASAYLASILLLGFFLAVDLFISALFTNQLAAFILSFIVNFAFIILGTDLINYIIPVSLSSYVFNLSPVDHFNQLAQGLIKLEDLLFFILADAGFLVLSWWRIKLIKAAGNKSLALMRGFSLNLLAVIVLAGAYFSFMVPGELDITSQQNFTLASGTREVLGDLDEEISLDLYLSRDLPPVFQPHLDALNRLFDQLSESSRGKLKVDRKYPQENQEVLQEATGLGIYPQSFSVISQTEYQAKEGYLGLNIKYQGKNEVIAFVDQSDQLEYQIMSVVFDLVRSEKPTIVYLQGKGGVGFEYESPNLNQQLSRSYQIETVSLPEMDEEERLQAEDLEGDIFVVGELSGPIHPDDLKLIWDKVKESGVSLLVFDDGVDLDLNTLAAIPQEQVFVNDLLEPFGVKINQDIVYDLRNANLLTFSTPQGQMLVTYPLWPTVRVNQDVPLLKDIGTVVTPWSSSIEIEEGSKLRPLLQTSQFAGALTENFNLAPDQDLTEENLGTKVVGAIRSKGQASGAVIVLGTPNLIKDQFLGGNQNNILFVYQLVDLAGQSESLASIRVKSRIEPQLLFTSADQKDTLKYMNLIGLPVINLAIGGIFWYMRRKKMAL